MRHIISRTSLALVLAVLAGCGPTAPRAQMAPPAIDAKPAAFEIENSAVLPLRSKILGRDYQVYVKTPPGYGAPENATRRYPVLYLTDGPYTFQVASAVSRLPFSQHRFNEFIVVGFSWAQGEAGADSRRRDLTPWKSAAPPGSGGGVAYLDHLKREALPLVEGRYRIDPNERALAGQSYGGLFGLWVALTEPSLFKTYILTSPSIWFADRSILKTEAAYAATHTDLKARIYLATGGREHPGPGGCEGCDTDMIAGQQALAQALTARNYPGLRLRTDVIEGGFHETTFPVGLINGMQWTYLK
jgi:predicted alpha/beta superfamily hydrolase